jgi:hypothetical protein
MHPPSGAPGLFHMSEILAGLLRGMLHLHRSEGLLQIQNPVHRLDCMWKQKCRREKSKKRRTEDPLNVSIRIEIFPLVPLNSCSFPFLASFTFDLYFLAHELWLGVGVVRRFAKAPAGYSVFRGETKRDSAKRGRRPAAPPDLRRNHRLVVSRSAALPPRPG